MLGDAAAVFEAAELIVKVKEPQASEIALLKPHHILFTYLHLAADRPQAEGLLASGCTAIAYETVSDRWGRLPLLAPMSQVAGRMAVDVGAYHLLRPHGGRGVLLGGAPGVPAARVHHLADLGRLQRFDVGLGHLLRGQVVAQSPGRVSGTFFLAQYAERNPRMPQHARQRQHDLAPLRIVRAHAA